MRINATAKKENAVMIYNIDPIIVTIKIWWRPRFVKVCA